VMLPARNRKDFEDIPEEARRQIEFVWLERVDDAVAAALEPLAPAPSSARADERPLAAAEA
jgi:ATP-dependent Lon protease